MSRWTVWHYFSVGFAVLAVMAFTGWAFGDSAPDNFLINMSFCALTALLGQQERRIKELSTAEDRNIRGV